ncbi:MAG: OadG family protein [Clostridia bacterium]|nr:OadG family protein [Clostridia bacterium]
MSIIDSLLVSIYGMAVVFIVLIILSFLVKLQSMIFSSMASKQEKQEVAKDNKISSEPAAQTDAGWTSGELKLIGVDEKTAAMIMAIVSDESKIPLSELQFKTIKVID